VKGLNAKLIDAALKGAQSKGAETKRYDLINCNIEFLSVCLSTMSCPLASAA